jgi:hypothetical protein
VRKTRERENELVRNREIVRKGKLEQRTEKGKEKKSVALTDFGAATTSESQAMTLQA